MPQQPKKMTKEKLMRRMSRMGPLTDQDRKKIERIDFKKIDYSGDFDKELAKFEKIAVPKAKGMDKTGYGPKIYDVRRISAGGRQQARDMMRTSKPEVRETKQDMIRRKKKDLGIVGQLTESELKTMKRSMSANERKMLSSK